MENLKKMINFSNFIDKKIFSIGILCFLFGLISSGTVMTIKWGTFVWEVNKFKKQYEAQSNWIGSQAKRKQDIEKWMMSNEKETEEAVSVGTDSN